MAAISYDRIRAASVLSPGVAAAKSRFMAASRSDPALRSLAGVVAGVARSGIGSPVERNATP